jgi:uncharacterized OB-fold protein
MNHLTPIQEFKDNLKKGELIGIKCSACESINVYPNFHCSNCRNASLEKIKLSGKGKLITYTILHAVPARFKENIPLIIGLVEFEEGGRISAHLDVSQDELSVGIKLEAIFQEKDGRIILKFKPSGGT